MPLMLFTFCFRVGHSRLLPFVFCLALMWLAPPAWGQQKFIDRNYRVRIALADKVHRVAIQGGQDYAVRSSAGAVLMQLRAGVPYFIDIIEGQPGDKTYRLVLRELDAHAVDTALDLARRAKDAYKLPVKVFRIPSREPGGGKILVTLGEFPTLDAARANVKSLGAENISLIYEDRAAAVRGQVRLFDQGGTILARDSSRLLISPNNPADGDIALARVKNEDWTGVGLAGARHYRGDLDLLINEEGTLTAVNDLWVEYYLYSVVGAEIGTDAPMEALKAQAVTGRSEAVAKYERGIVSNAFFDCNDTAIAQAYPGRKSESESVRQAVDGTRGELLVSNGFVVDAVYSHSCGGEIPSRHDMWDSIDENDEPRHMDLLLEKNTLDLSSWKASEDYLASDAPALCNPAQKGYPTYAKKYYRWTRSFTGAEFSRLADKLYETGPVMDIYVDQRTPSGRVRQLRIIGRERTVKVNQELELRSALGDIYSTFFTLVKSRGSDGLLRSLTIHGGGFGHGVGMCQMGAYMMALKGYSYRQILAHYYSNVKIRRLYR